MTVRSHVYNTLVQHTRYMGRCTVQIRNPIVCDKKKVTYMCNNKPSLVVELAFPLMEFADW